uniref:Peptidase M14 domain-containing protein n=1 Tax=Wuchereria bancrofti TaxID=6293 RepID=A0AAF5Q2J7_WUCBA
MPKEDSPTSALDDGCDVQNSLSASVIRLIEMVLKGDNEAKLREQTEISIKLYSESAAKNVSSYRFLLKGTDQSISFSTATFQDVNNRSTDEYLGQLLKAIEVCRNELTTSFFCQFLLGFITCCKPSASLIRQRRIIRLDGTNSLIRRFASFIAESVYCSSIDILSSLLIMLYVRDKKFCLKVRLDGLIMLFRKKLLLLAKDRKMISVLQLCCCCIRSVQNARMFGRSQEFVKNLITSIISGTDAIIVARLVEILYIIIKFKNRLIMTVLESNDIFAMLTKTFQKYFQQRFITSEQTTLEICLFTVASLRNLMRLKRNRERLLAIGAMETFGSAISLISKDNKCLDDNSQLGRSIINLKDSLITLYMSCLPLRPFPIASSTPPPIIFPLPKIDCGSAQQQFPWLHGKKVEENFLYTSSIQQDKSALSSDEDDGDEEDEALFTVAPLHDNDKDSSHPVFARFHHHHLSLTELTDDYLHYFTEFFQGTIRAGSSSMTTILKTEVENFADLVAKAVKKTRSPSVFIKIAYPTTISPTNLFSVLQPLAKINSRDLLIKDITHLQEESSFSARIVYDLDCLICDKTKILTTWKTIGNDDENRIGKMDSKNHLLFESRFEGGNLRRAIQVNKWHYQLILSPDINQLRSHFQWFFFEVSNNESGVDYIFEIINCFKKTSMFNRGMQPVLFSVTEACQGNPKWVRTGSAICYCRNAFIRNDSRKLNDTSAPRHYFSLYFTIRFKYRADVCYIAYHFPYTYSMLQATLERYLSKNDKRGQRYVRNDKLCTSLAGNSVSLLTVTANGTKKQLDDRQIILIFARVHPGENNTSWIMHGIMDFLMSDKEEAMELRDQFVFKLIPMLNVDGVVNGSHRCSLAGVDLNRTWDQPSSVLHPVIYHSKAIVQYIVDVLGKKPFLFIDLHGHSNNFNLFLYGNNPDNSWRILDHSLPGRNDFMSLPLLLQQMCNYFSLSNCRFNITKTKESSARVTLWKQFGITRSYTLESTYCGFNCGSLQGYQVNIEHLMDMGRQLCKTFSYLKNDNPPNQKADDDDSE